MSFLNNVKKIFAPRTFRYLDKKIHSGVKEIILDSDIKLGRLEKSKYEREGIKLDVDDLIIDGNGHTIDANGEARIFYCTGKNITIKNITIKNGLPSYKEYNELKHFNPETIDKFINNGGAIYNIGEVTITDSIITDNTSPSHNEYRGIGGAIHNRGNMTIAKSTLTKNNAHEGSGGAIFNRGKLNITESVITENTAFSGGAINNSGELTITGSIITNNETPSIWIDKGYGGAVSNSGKLTITESIITKNTAYVSGGAITNSGKVTITESKLIENTATQKNGGAISNGGEVTITESKFIGNTAKYGGAISNSGELTITESTLTKNTAQKNGGVICNRKGIFKSNNCEISDNNSNNNIIYNKDHMEFFDSIFKDNHASNILYNNENGTVSISYGEFKDNVADSIVYNDGNNCFIGKTLFKNKDSKNIINKTDLTLKNPKIKDEGKTILNEGYVLIKEDCENISNHIGGKGEIECDKFPLEERFDFGYLDKKIHENNSKEIVLEEDIHFEIYERDYYEGGIELDIDDLVIDGNGHTIDGADKSRIFIITGKNITLKNIIFKNGHSHYNHYNKNNSNGGAIKINHKLNTTIKNCKFKNNISKKIAGAIQNEDGELTIIKSDFSENVAESSGAIGNIGGVLTITGSTLTGNNANLSGGAISNNEGVLTITGSTLTGNVASYGGAISNREGVLTIIESKFIGNIAKRNFGHGGAINNEFGELTITESTLTKNTANYGGAIYCRGMLNNKKNNITESKLTENTAKNGGAIYSIAKTFYHSNCEFKNNIPNNGEYEENIYYGIYEPIYF